MLVPADLERMVPPGLNPFDWAQDNLRASPGALVVADGKPRRIGTLVPAVKANGECINLTNGGGCAIHDISPFGCAFFDCAPVQNEEAARQGLMAVMREWASGAGLYVAIWAMLYLEGRTQRPPEELRERIAVEEERLSGQIPSHLETW
jgi:hypothetical protein